MVDRPLGREPRRAAAAAGDAAPARPAAARAPHAHRAPPFMEGRSASAPLPPSLHAAAEAEGEAVEAHAAALLAARLRSSLAVRGAPATALAGWSAVVTYARGDHAAAYVAPDGVAYSSRADAAASVGVDASAPPRGSRRERTPPPWRPPCWSCRLAGTWGVGGPRSGTRGAWPSRRSPRSCPPRRARRQRRRQRRLLLLLPSPPPPPASTTPPACSLWWRPRRDHPPAPHPARRRSLTPSLAHLPPPRQRLAVAASPSPRWRAGRARRPPRWSCRPPRFAQSRLLPPPTRPPPAAARPPLRLRHRGRGRRDRAPARRRRGAGGVLEGGWVADVRTRRDGVSAGAADIYFYSPHGGRFRSVAAA